MSVRQRVLVTGGTGFIGRRVVKRLLEAGLDVTSFGLAGEQSDPSWGRPVRIEYGDLRNIEDVIRAARDTQLIIHLAAVVGVPGDYNMQWQVIAEGTRLVCEVAGALNARVVVASSIAVYGDLIQRQVCREDSGFGPWQGAYGRAKQGQETIARYVCQAFNIPLTIIRPANVYGLGGSGAWGDKLLEYIKATGGAVVGEAERNNAGLVHVENLADAIALAATHDQAIGQTFNVCDEEPITWRQFMNDMAAQVGLPPPPSYPLAELMAAAKANEDPRLLQGPRDTAVPMLEGLNLVGFDNRIDSSLIRNRLKWVPKVTYQTGMSRQN